jgi:allantoin racemase
MHLLLINPNTREALTRSLVEPMAPRLGLPLIGATAAFGDDYIASEASYVVGAHAVLDAWERHVTLHGCPQAVLVACFGDPGVWALREKAGVPVIGLAEAAMREAAAHGPFGIVTGGAAWGPMLTRLARGLDINALQAVQTVAMTGDQLASDPERGTAALQEAVDAVTAQVRCVVLGGAALGSFAARLRVADGSVLIDSIDAGCRWLGSTGGLHPK